jgi:predicted 3-demethylubiquinone-9 3-methyltransferase (glyoxalase superfamily)
MKVLPFLMFEGKCEEAINFYVSLIPQSRIIDIVRFGPGQPGKEGSVMRATFSVGGQTVMGIDSAVKHAFTFTPSVSFFVECESEDQLDRIAAELGAGGNILMPLGSYGFSRKFTWLNDRFGVSWQLNLS